MKKLLLIVGIVIVIAGVIALLYAFLNLYGYHHVLDGEPELYSRLHRRMIIHFIAGGACTLIGALCLIIRSRG